MLCDSRFGDALISNVMVFLQEDHAIAGNAFSIIMGIAAHNNQPVDYNYSSIILMLFKS